MPAEEVKPCPFCGCVPEYVGNGYGTSYACVNDDCATSGSWSFRGDDAKERALELWNLRADTVEACQPATNSAMDVIGALNDCIQACNDNGLYGISEQLERVRDTVRQLRQ